MGLKSATNGEESMKIHKEINVQNEFISVVDWRQKLL